MCAHSHLQVRADSALVATLLQTPLCVSVFKQAASSGTAAGGAARAAVLVGTAELDLSPLCWPAAGTAQQHRSAGGVLPLVNDAAAAQGGGSLAARVELQLAPNTSAAQQAAGAAAVGADTTNEVWQLEGQPLPPAVLLAASQPTGAAQHEPRLQQQQPLQQPAQQPAQQQCHDASSDDEELLEHCRQLTAAGTAANATVPAAASSSTASGSGSGSRAGSETPEACSTRQQQQQQTTEPAAGANAPPEQQQETGSASGPSSVGQLPAGTPAAGSSAAPASPAAQRQQQVAAEQRQEPGVEEASGALLVRFETALNLPESLPGSSGSAGSRGAYGSPYLAFGEAVWQGRRWRTRAVPVHAVEAAELCGTAVWHQELEVGPAAAAAWAVGAGAGGPSLLLNVWAAAAGSDASSAAAVPPDRLLGCVTLDLSGLGAGGEQHGWFGLVDAQQAQRGQLKAAVSADDFLRRHLLQQQQEGFTACAAGIGSVAGGQQPEEQHEDLMQQLQVQLQGLESLSQRLAAAPPLAATAAPTAAPPAPAPSQASVAPQTGQPQAGRPEAMYLRDLPASDDDDAPPFDARQVRNAGCADGGPGCVAAAGRATGWQRPHLSPCAVAPACLQSWRAWGRMQLPSSCLLACDPSADRTHFPPGPACLQVGCAWSGSDSDGDLALLGVAIEGAVSPGFSDVELAEEEEQRSRCGRPARVATEGREVRGVHRGKYCAAGGACTLRS